MFILQEQYGEYDETEIKKFDQKISELQNKLKGLQEKWKLQESGVHIFPKLAGF